jgi:hypothetical protein
MTLEERAMRRQDLIDNYRRTEQELERAEAHARRLRSRCGRVLTANYMEEDGAIETLRGYAPQIKEADQRVCDLKNNLAKTATYLTGTEGVTP